METATATAAPPVRAGILPRVGHEIEPEGAIWVNLGIVARHLGSTDPDGFHRLAEAKGVEIQVPAGSGWPSARRRDLPALIGEAQARAVVAMQEREGIEFVDATAGVRYVAGVSRSELIGLARRRGVLVYDAGGGNPRASRSGLVTLGRILERERSLSRPLEDRERRGAERRGEPVPPEDWFAGAQALPPMRASMRTHGGFAAGDHIDLTDRDRPRENPDSELVHRCQLLGIRWRREPIGKWTRGRAQPLGFDLHRLAGITLPGMDLERYGELIDQAYREETGREPPGSPPQPAD